MRVVLARHDAVPAEADRPQLIEMLAANVGDAGAFRAEHPLVPVGRQEVDAHLVHVERKDAQALNRIEEHQRARSDGRFRQSAARRAGSRSRSRPSSP